MTTTRNTPAPDAGDMRTESLPADGADFPCGFGATLYGETWRCPKPATMAVTADTMPTELPDTFHIHGRAMCDTHLDTLRDYV